jgi:uncharacterized membrane protein YbhN (UPF0104 family)
MAVQGTNVLLPAGGASGLAVGAWALDRMGEPRDRIAHRSVALFLITSSVNFVAAVLAGAGLALGLLPGDASLALTAGPAALAAVSIAMVLTLPRWLDRVEPREGRIAGALATAAAALAAGVRESRTLVASGSVAIIGGAIGWMALDLAALSAAFAAVGSMPPLGILLLAYVVGQLGGLIPVPGGIGGADTGVIGAMVLYGTPLPDATAAVLAYRAFQLGVPALLGSIALLRLPGVVARAADGPRVAPARAPAATPTPLPARPATPLAFPARPAAAAQPVGAAA